jgi:hypothetical protein
MTTHRNLEAVVNLPKNGTDKQLDATRDMIISSLVREEPFTDIRGLDLAESRAETIAFENDVLDSNVSDSEREGKLKQGKKTLEIFKYFYYGEITPVTIFEGDTPVLHAVVGDEWYQDDWEDYYDGTYPAPDSAAFRAPTIGYVVGNIAHFRENTGATTAVAGLFAVIEARQQHTRYELTRNEAMAAMSEWGRTTGESHRTLGTLPAGAYVQAVQLLASELEPAPFTQASAKPEDDSYKLSISI